MSDLKQVGEIEIHEDLPFLEAEWRVQRFGWIAIGLILIMALLGGFGHGRLAHGFVGDARTFGVEFDRIIRHGSETRLSLHVGPGAQTDSALRILFSRDYLSEMNIPDIIPQPAATGADGPMVYFDFARADGRKPVRIIFHMRAGGYWKKRATIGLAGSKPINFNQFVLP